MTDCEKKKIAEHIFTAVCTAIIVTIATAILKIPIGFSQRVSAMEDRQTKLESQQVFIRDDLTKLNGNVEYLIRLHIRQGVK